MELTQKQLEIIKNNSKSSLEFSDEQILEIRKMATFILNKYPSLKFDEDIIQEISTKIACYSIYKYNPEKSKLSTFIFFCIDNFIKHNLRTKKAKFRSVKTISLNSILKTNGEKEFEFAELVADEKARNENEENNFINFLNERIEKYEILKLYFYEKMGQDEIAKKLKISQSYISRLIKKELKQLKEECIKNGFDHDILAKKQDSPIIFKAESMEY